MKPAEMCNPLFFEEAQRPCQESEVINPMKESEELVKVFYEVDSLTERGGSPFDGCNSTPNKSIDNEEFLM